MLAAPTPENQPRVCQSCMTQGASAHQSRNPLEDCDPLRHPNQSSDASSPVDCYAASGRFSPHLIYSRSVHCSRSHNFSPKSPLKPSILPFIHGFLVLTQIWVVVASVDDSLIAPSIYTQHRHKLCFLYWRNQTDTTHKQGLSALLILRFQRFEKAQVVAV